MRETDKYEKPALSTTPLEMDCAFMSVSLVDLNTDSEQKSATQKFNDGQYQEIY